MILLPKLLLLLLLDISIYNSYIFVEEKIYGNKYLLVSLLDIVYGKWHASLNNNSIIILSGEYESSNNRALIAIIDTRAVYLL